MSNRSPITFGGSFSKYFIVSFVGIEKIWCSASHLFSSSFHENNGKSVTQQNLNSFVIRFSFLAISILNFDNMLLTIFSSSAMKSNRESFLAFVFLIISFCIFSGKNFTIEDSKDLPLYFIHARPLAPCFIEKSINESISFLENLHFSTFIHLIKGAFLNTWNSDFFTMSVIFINSKSNLKSGLSVPYLSIASLYVSLGNFLRLIFRIFWKMSL